MALAKEVRWPVAEAVCDDPHAKANLLLQVRHKPHNNRQRSVLLSFCC